LSVCLHDNEFIVVVASP